MNTYGRGGQPPPPNPPLAQESDCQVVMVPSFFAPILILPYAEGLTPAISSSVARSRNSLTGLPPLSFESCVHSTPQVPGAHVLPSPPPTVRIGVYICGAHLWRLIPSAAQIAD